MAKKKAVKKDFNLRNPSEIRLLAMLSQGEGIIDRSQFPNDTLYYKFKRNGHIKERPDGKLQITAAFKHDYKTQVNPSAHFAGSGAGKHAASLANAIKLLPQDIVKQSIQEPYKSPIQNGKQLADKANSLKKTPEYKAFVLDITQKYQQRLSESQKAFAAAKTNREKVEAITQQKFNSKMLKGLEKGNVISPPDMSVKLTHDQLDSYIDRLREFNELNNKSVHTRYQSYERAIERLQQVSMSMVTQTVEISIEIITSNYTADKIEGKEIYSTQVIHQPIIFLQA